MALACTQAERDALAAAIKSGVEEVAYAGGRRVRYGSFEDMRKVLAEMDEFLAGASAAPRFSRAAFSRD